MPRPRLYRDAILALLRRNPTHPTVDWIHQALRKREPRVSLATVYRTLRVLLTERVLCELPFGAGQSRFGLVKEQNHYHFICDSCGHIHDLPGPPRAGLETAVAKATGHRVIRHTTEFFGVCKSCLTKAASSVKAKTARQRKTAPKGGQGKGREGKGRIKEERTELDRLPDALSITHLRPRRRKKTNRR